MSHTKQNDNGPIICFLLFLFLAFVFIFSDPAKAADLKDFRGKPEIIYTEKIPPSIYSYVKYESKFFAKYALGVEGEEFKVELDEEELNEK